MILKLNRDQRGLMLIGVEDGLIVCDVDQKTVKGDFAYDPEVDLDHGKVNQVLSVLRTDDSSYWNRHCYKIIFATQDLNLPGVPLILDKSIELEPKKATTTITLEQAKLIWDAGQEYWKTSGESITFEELITRRDLLFTPQVEIIFNEDQPVKCIRQI
jgi:hypothetical protein